MLTVDFLRAIWPAQGWYCIAVQGAKGLRHQWYESIEAAAAGVGAAEAAGGTVYHACSSFASKKNRKAANVEAVKAFWIDVDCGDAKPYVSQRDAAVALAAFVRRYALPAPLVINSGYGLHVYFIQPDALAAADARSYARVLKELAREADFRIDTTRTADLSSVLRPVGTSNRKGPVPRAVTALNEARPADIRGLLDEHRGRLGVLHEPADRTSTINDELTLLPRQYAESDPERVVAACAQLGKWVRESDSIDNPLWYCGVEVLHFCKDGDAFIRAHTAEHRQERIAAKIEQVSHFGPTTCKRIEQCSPDGGCAECPHQGKLSSPISLGVTYVERTDIPDVISTDDEPLEFILPPKGFKRTPQGVVRSTLDGDVLAYDNDLFVISLAFDHLRGYEIATVQHHLPQEGWATFDFRSSDVGNDRTFEQTFRDNHVKPLHNTALRYYVAAYMKQVQDASRMQTLHDSTGWRDDGSFVLVPRIYHPDGASQPAGISPARKTMLDGVGAAGELDPWVAITRLFDMPGMEACAFTGMVWAGAPLMRLAGYAGALFSVVGPTSAGKSTWANFSLSAYGDWRRLQVLENDTVNHKLAKLGALGALPMYIDEVSNVDPAQFSDFVYQVTQGRSKGGQTRENAARETYRWDTIVTASSNASLSAKLGLSKANPMAERMRLFEYRVTSNPAITKDAAKAVTDAYTVHYGVAGARYIEYVVNNPGECRAGVRAAIAALDTLTGASGAERFISAGVGSVLYGSVLAKRLALVDFDVARLWRWAVEAIREYRDEVDASSSDELDILGRYLNAHRGERIVLDESEKASGFGTTLARTYEMPRNEITARVEVDTGFLFIERRHLADWLAHQHEDLSSLRKGLVKRGIPVLTMRKTLTAGTGVGSASTDCVRIDLKNPSLGNVKMMLVAPSVDEVLKGAGLGPQ